VHLVVDGKGCPLAMHVTAGQRHESRYVEAVMRKVKVHRHRGRPRWRPKHLAGDKGYSFPHIRRWLKQHGITAVIAQKKNQRLKHRQRPLPFNRRLYRRRNVIERCVGWLKENRRVATRYEKLAVNYEGMFKLAMIYRYLHMPISNRA
jgi:transposase